VLIAPAQHRSDPCGKLIDIERLSHVIVRPQLEGPDLVLTFCKGGQANYRGLNALPTGLTEHYKAGFVGESHAENRCVVAVGRRQFA
jgi:hypothetical protein